MSKGQPVRVIMGKLGILVAEDRKVSFTFHADSYQPLPPQPSSSSLALIPSSSRCIQTAVPSTRRSVGGLLPPKDNKYYSINGSTQSQTSRPLTSTISTRSSSLPQISSLPSDVSQQQPPLPSSQLPQHSSSSSNRVGGVEWPFNNGVSITTTASYPPSTMPSYIESANEWSSTPDPPKMGRGKCNRRNSQNAVYQQTMADAYERLERRLAQQVNEEERAMKALREHNALIEEEHQKVNMMKKKKQEEWKEYLTKQAEDNRRRKEEMEQYYLAPPPSQIITAFPQRSCNDRKHKIMVELSVRATLDEQVRAKEERKRAERIRELQMDRQMIDLLQQEERQEKNRKLATRIREKESLFREWGLQKAHQDHLKKMGPIKML